MRKALIVLVIPVLVCGGCSSRADVRAAPECPGSMSTDFDLGTVLRSAIPQLPRSGSGIDTGAPTVTIAPESRKRIVAVRLCAPNYSHEETVDAATALGQADRPCPPCSVTGSSHFRARTTRLVTLSSAVLSPPPNSATRQTWTPSATNGRQECCRPAPYVDRARERRYSPDRGTSSSDGLDVGRAGRED